MGPEPPFSDPPELHGEQSDAPRAGSEEPRRGRRSDRRDRSTHRSGGRLWKLGAAIVPPVATIGGALALIGWWLPPLLAVPSMMLLAYAVLAALGISLLLMIPGLNRNSRRLKRREFWLAILLAVIVIAALLLVLHRARQRAGSDQSSQPTAPAPQPSD